MGPHCVSLTQPPPHILSQFMPVASPSPMTCPVVRKAFHGQVARDEIMVVASALGGLPATMIGGLDKGNIVH